MLVQRDAFLLANTLEKLTGPTVAHVVFGIGVVGMAFSTIIILMLINGFTVCEMMGISRHPGFSTGSSACCRESPAHWGSCSCGGMARPGSGWQCRRVFLGWCCCRSPT